MDGDNSDNSHKVYCFKSDVHISMNAQLFKSFSFNLKSENTMPIYEHELHREYGDLYSATRKDFHCGHKYLDACLG